MRYGTYLEVMRIDKSIKDYANVDQGNDEYEKIEGLWICTTSGLLEISTAFTYFGLENDNNALLLFFVIAEKMRKCDQDAIWLQILACYLFSYQSNSS